MKALSTIVSLLISGTLLAQAEVQTFGKFHYDEEPSAVDYQIWNNLSQQWVTYDYVDLVHGQHGPLTAVHSEYLGGPLESRRTATYDTQGNMTNFLHETWDSTQWVPFRSSVSQFDAQNRRVYNHIFDHDLPVPDTTQISQWHFTFDINGKLATSYALYGNSLVSMDTISREEFHYTAAGEPDSILYSTRFNPAWELRWLTVYSPWYDYQAGLPDTTWTYSYTANTWELDSREIRVNQGGRTVELRTEEYVASALDGLRFRYVDAFDYLVKDSTIEFTLPGSRVIQNTYTRNGQGKITEILISEKDTTGYHPYNLIELFYPATSVMDAQPKDQWTVYPQPATNTLNIRFAERPAGLMTLRLYDLQGRLRMVTQSPAMAGDLSLNIPDVLESGRYILEVQGQAGIHRQQVSIIR